MTERKVYIGSHGPILYDDTDLINDGDGDFSGKCFGPLISDGIVTFGGLALTPGAYISFGTYGSSGYGIRDNSGEMEYKDSGDSWKSFHSAAEAFKVGGIYLNSTGNDPATELGYGTWELVAQGLILVGHV